tara:strand:+ start:229 stop:492 length:264 start_codon:yes stop_codon:yes gene_type:complete
MIHNTHKKNARHSKDKLPKVEVENKFYDGDISQFQEVEVLSLHFSSRSMRVRGRKLKVISPTESVEVPHVFEVSAEPFFERYGVVEI